MHPGLLCVGNEMLIAQSVYWQQCWQTHQTQCTSDVQLDCINKYQYITLVMTSDFVYGSHLPMHTFIPQ